MANPVSSTSELKLPLPLTDPAKLVEQFAEEELAKTASDRQMFASEIRRVCDGIYQTIAYMTAKGHSQLEILAKVRESITLGRAELASVRGMSKTALATFTTSSARFAAAASAPALNFDLLKPPTRAERITKAKTEISRCVQRLDFDNPIPTSVGCIEKVMKDHPVDEQKELEAFIPKAAIGDALNGILVPIAAAAKAVNTAVSLVFEGMLVEAALEFDPEHYQEIVAQTKELITSPQTIQKVKETLPEWSVSAVRFLISANEKLSALDLSLHEEFGTFPGAFHESSMAVVEAASFKVGGLFCRGAGLGVRMGGQMLRETRKVTDALAEGLRFRKLQLSPSLVRSFIRDERGTFRLPQINWHPHFPDSNLLFGERKILMALRREALPEPTLNLNSLPPSTRITLNHPKLQATLLLHVTEDSVVYMHRTLYQGKSSLFEGRVIQPLKASMILSKE